MTWSTDMATDAAELVSLFGSARTFRARTLSSFNTTTGARGMVTGDTSIDMIRSAITKRTEFTGRGSMHVCSVKFSATAAALSAASITPDPNDTIIDGSDTWRIVSIERKMDGAMVEFVCERSSTT